LGDALREIQRRWENIGDTQQAQVQHSISAHENPPSAVEYLQEGMDEDHDMQALGSAQEEQLATLKDLIIRDDDSSKLAEPVEENSDIPPSLQEGDLQDLSMTAMHGDNDGSSKPVVPQGPDSEQQFAQTSQSHVPNVLPGGESHIMDSGEVSTETVEIALKKWQEAGQPHASARDIWRLYDSLTTDLSFALCEQLRLILEPTLATRLRGDYRTGKRLNMKKIIPYIASEFTKDKIWLRRTRPSQREYQVLIALDDSRSMADSHSVHLAYETLALVSKALNRLESGEIGIARFGESFEMVHNFKDGVVDGRKGEKIMQQFSFAQRRTDVLDLLDSSLRILTQAREHKSTGRSSAGAQELWQLEIIVSDGICQDHDRLRAVLRKAEEQRVMVVFVVLDSLRTHHDVNQIGHGKSAQDSILSMTRVFYKDVGGRMEMELKSYMDSFPFEYYVILRDIEALPDVLSNTLKQFFERVSEE